MIAINASDRNGPVVSVAKVSDDHDFFVITHSGAIIRMQAHTVSLVGRNTQGVRLIQLSDNDTVVGCQVLLQDASDTSIDDDPAASDELGSDPEDSSHDDESVVDAGSE